ncbi:MAG TPA: universal stress protein [Candidatus Eisenbacteria bacterium]|nr:universal stress protein [Candidatus Eisenbacteria bacterium]
MIAFRRILVPHDFSKHADRSLRVAADLAGPRGTLVVQHTVVPFIPVTDLPPAGLATYLSPEELITGARRQLEATVKRVLRGRGPKVTLRVEIGDAYQRILAATRGMDLVVLATAGRTGLSHLIIGSVAEKVVRHSPIPVLTLRPEVSRRAAPARRAGSRR